MKLRNALVLITGASGGIGAATAHDEDSPALHPVYAPHLGMAECENGLAAPPAAALARSERACGYSRTSSGAAAGQGLLRRSSSPAESSRRCAAKNAVTNDAVYLFASVTET